MYESSEQREWAIYLEELKKIDIEEVRAYLLAQKWEQQDSQYDERGAYIFVNSERDILLLLPMNKKLSDFYARLAESLRIMALSEGVWYPRLVERFIHEEKSIEEVKQATGMSRFTLSQVAREGRMGKAAVRKGRNWKIDTEHPDYKAWLAAHEYQPRVRGEKKNDA